MEAKTLLSWGYWFSAWSLGLLLHPYMTVRKIVREKFLRPLVLLPMVSGILLWIATVMMVHGGALLLSSLGMGLPSGIKASLAFMFWWMAWFLGLWQVVLIYLFVRFTKVLSPE